MILTPKHLEAALVLTFIGIPVAALYLRSWVDFLRSVRR